MEFRITAPEEVLLYEEEIQRLVTEELLHFEQIATREAETQYRQAFPQRHRMRQAFPASLMKGYHHLIGFYIEDAPEIEITRFSFLNTAFHSSELYADVLLYGECVGSLHWHRNGRDWNDDRINADSYDFIVDRERY